MKDKICFIVLLALLFCSSLGAQKGVVVLASTDKSKVLLGEQFDLVIGARFTTETNLSFFTIDSLQHFEIVQKSKVDTERTGKNTVLTQKITLLSFDSGRWQIPALSLPVTQLKTKPISIDVVFTSPFDPKQDYHDVKEILSVKKPIESNWYWYLIGAILLLLLFILLFPRKKKDAKENRLDANAYKTAITDLQKLKKEDLAEKDVKTFYVRMVDIFRRYLHAGKGLQSFSKTTDDLALQVMNLDLPMEPYNELVQVLRLSDAVKYAKFTPSHKENNDALDIIRESIDTIEKR
jgi:LPXTG-motif cell wall-anchored protein